jgi:hypothetical protein
MTQNKHRRLLGKLFFGFGVVSFLLLLLTLLNNLGSMDAVINNEIFIPILISASIFIICGLLILKSSRFAHWVCIPVSVIYIFVFPIGTAIGGYCLWYFWKFGLYSK